jgi:ComF family protein
VNNWLNIIQNKCLPPRCILCGQPGYADMDFCEACFGELPRNHGCCYRCAEHFEMTIHSPQLCGRCLKKPPSFDETHAPFLYSDSLRYLTTQLKFNQQYKNARLLGTLLANHLATSVEFPEVIVPVPLHPKRYRERGFNQSIEIARQVSKLLAIPLNLQSCIRNRDTDHQTELPAKQRRKNMRNAFSVCKDLTFQHVAILDDVMTTGATVDALATTLKQHGVTRVDVWVCARA